VAGTNDLKVVAVAKEVGGAEPMLEVVVVGRSVELDEVGNITHNHSLIGWTPPEVTCKACIRSRNGRDDCGQVSLCD
jgi:hypothetical protein